MPTYDYRCGSCGHEFELFQSMTAKPERVCPKCRRAALTRLIGTGAALLFKGSGFYQTDYRSESYKKAAEADAKGPSSDTSTVAGDAKAPATDSGAPTKPGAGKGEDAGKGEAASGAKPAPATSDTGRVGRRPRASPVNAARATTRSAPKGKGKPRPR